jgi:putative multiple sugar transport system permease protein
MEKVAGILKKNAMIFALLAVVIFFSVATGGKMILPQNVNNLISQNAYVFILATGMLLCILTGGNIDLSVGCVVCISGAAGGSLMIQRGVSPALAIPVMILMGVLIGIWQGFWIAYVRIPSFIVTLAGMLIWRGFSNVILQGLTLAPFPENYLAIFNSYVPDFMGGTTTNYTCILVGIVACIIYIFSQLRGRIIKAKKGYEVEKMSSMVFKAVVICAAILWFTFKLALYKGIPFILIWIAAVILIYTYITQKTVIGRHFYAVGGNEKATKLSGINTNRILFVAYLNMSFLAAVAGLVTAARLNSANPTAGTNYEMDAIGACFIGGASAYGGIGSTSGVVVGALLMGIINLGMSIMGVDANWQKVVKGMVLLAAVIFDVLSKKQSNN